MFEGRDGLLAGSINGVQVRRPVLNSRASARLLSRTLLHEARVPSRYDARRGESPLPSVLLLGRMARADRNVYHSTWKISLVSGAITTNAARQDLAPFGYIFLQTRRVFIVNKFNFISTEITRLASSNW